MRWRPLSSPGAPRSLPHASMHPATSTSSMPCASSKRSQNASPREGAIMTAKRKATVYGIAMRNFTKYPEMPDARALIDYGVRMEELGYESLWAWDHILL